MKKADIGKTKTLIANIEKVKDQIAEDRNTLRELVDEAEEIIEDSDNAITSFVNAIRDMKDGLDTISKYL